MLKILRGTQEFLPLPLSFEQQEGKKLTAQPQILDVDTGGDTSRMKKVALHVPPKYQSKIINYFSGGETLNHFYITRVSM